VKITLLPSAVSADAGSQLQYLTTYLVNDTIAIDAGALGFFMSPREQAAIRHVFLSHTHVDHVASLPIFLENVAGAHPTPVTVYASDAVQQSLRLDLFNGRVWPNFLELTHERGRFANLATIRSGVSVDVDGLRITPIDVDHVVPTLGFILEDDVSAVVISSDTAPTDAIWEAANRTANPKAVFLEATFPVEEAALAELTKHLTTAQFVEEMRKLHQPATFFAMHIRARLHHQVTQELLAYKLPNLQVAQFGKVYEF
jgi:ribonuclease BN (tRNA processing enzyme)